MDAANSSPLITVTESCLTSQRLLNQQRHPGLLGQMQPLEQDCCCLLPSHSSSRLQSYGTHTSEKDAHLCISAGTPGPAHACREPSRWAATSSCRPAWGSCCSPLQAPRRIVVPEPCSVSLWRGCHRVYGVLVPPHVHGHVL